MTDTERQVQADLYCAFHNTIELYKQAKGMRMIAGEKSVLDEINKVEVEVPVEDNDKADIVVFKKDTSFLVIEVKKRAYTQSGRSLAAASKQVNRYALKLQSPFSAVCDGWIFILYQTYRNFQPINIYGLKTNIPFAEKLLSGLIMIDSNRDGSKYLSELPNVPDPSLVMKRIVPIIEKKLELKFPNL